MLLEISVALGIVNARYPEKEEKEEWGEDG
jgi:hypothetical protein